MPKPVNVITYSWNELQKWKVEIQQNRENYNDYLRIIETQEHYLQPLERNLWEIDSKIASVQAQLEKLKNYLTDPSQPSMSLLLEGYRISNINQLAQLQSNRNQIIEEMQPYETVVAKAQEKIQELKNRYDWLTTHIPAAGTFLFHLKDNPAQLVNELKQKLINTMNHYEKHHLVGLSPQVRISLLYVRFGMNRLIEDVADKKTQQKNYLILCAFLHGLYLKVKDEDEDPTFLNCLAEVINSTHLLPQDDLPAELATGFNAEAWYQHAKEQAEIFTLTGENLLAAEKYYFDYAMINLLAPDVPCYTSLQQKIIQAARTMDEEIKDKNQRNEAIDYYFYTNIANNLFQVYNNANDLPARERLVDMAEYASGTSLMSKKLLGSLAVVFGSLLIGASIASFVCTLGSSSFLSAWSFALGLTLLQTQIVVSTGLCFAAGAGAGITFWGNKTLQSCRRQGFSQELVDIQEEAANPSGYAKPPLYSPESISTMY